MADSLFDNRYRYDFIYPRGRSGETLRGVDTAQNDRPVVIKRPAPNDAPPIRAGQEVSILNERKALMRLAGHPVLTELLGSGQFFAGGMPHQYIVMERAQGAIIADFVVELARQGERMPTLELLVIMDALLDLLQAAHARDIVYNDVDAKHLFWDRDSYRLKVIDWGNAVFLEGDETTPQGISRQSDIFQAGELLYFMLCGGRRPDIPRDADANFALDFGEDGERISPTLQAIVSKAAHPNARLRYRHIEDLRRALAEYRAPLEKDRDAMINRVAERLRRDLSKNELRGLLTTIEPVLNSDPGHPATRKVYQDTNDRLRDLDVAADLDAVQIYMQRDNWSRAADVLHELRERAGTQTAALVDLLLDYAELVLDSPLPATPPAVYTAADLIFEHNVVQAAQVLLTHDNPDDDGRRLQWLLAERISSRVPDVLLLRPNLFRLELALNTIEYEGINISEGRALLAEVNTLLDNLPGTANTNLAELRDGYRAVVDRLATLNKLLSTVIVQQQLPHKKLPLTPLERATNAAMTLADNMHVIGKQAASSPRDALVALDNSRSIDPTTRLWRALSEMLDRLYEHLESYQTYVPAADGSDLDGWFVEAHDALQPYLDKLFDEMLAGMVEGLTIARRCWSDYGTAVIAGNRMGAITALAQASDAVGTVSPALAAWLSQLRSVVDGSHYIERHAIFGGLGRALADGWEAFDRGRLPDAERLGQQALEIARSEPERIAAKRLLDLAGLARDWVERSGATSARRTQAALDTVESLFTSDELTHRDNFASQMPSRETYLKAMQKGLIDMYRRSSTAALRLFYLNAILLGTLEAHDGNLDDARFWQDVAVRTMGDIGARHLITRTLGDFIERRKDILAGTTLINQITGAQALKTLESTRRQLEENPQNKLLAAGVHSLRELELALRDWADGEFRAAGLKIENAMNALSDLEQAADVTLTAYRSCLVELQAAAAELHTHARQMRQAIERRPAEPSDVIYDAHRRQVEVTTRLLGETYAAQLRVWYETYTAFLTVYTDHSVRRSARLERFNELFRAMFIDRHPAYPLYRHWFDLTERSPEFPAPPTSDPTPRLREDEVIEVSDFRPPPPDRPTGVPDDDAEPEFAHARPRLTLGRIAAGLVLLLAAAGVIVVLTSQDGREDDPFAGVQVTLSATPESITEATDAAVAMVEFTPEVISSEAGIGDGPTPTRTPTERPTATDTPTPTDTPVNTPTDEPTATSTDEPPTETATATNTSTATASYTPTLTPTPTLPAQGLQGWQELLELPERMVELPWDLEYFSPMPGSAIWRLGVGGVSEGDELHITFPAEILDLFYGNGAPARIRRTDARLSLATYVPSLLDTHDVYFGLMLQSVHDPTQRAGLYVEVVNLNVLNLYLRTSDETPVFVTQISVNAVNPRVRLERDGTTGAVTVFVDDRQIGQPIPFVAPEAAVQPILFVKDGGVILNVSGWRIGLR